MHQETVICLNGSYLPAHEARLPVADRGFRFGDGLFESIHLIDGVPYQWELHLTRLDGGLSALRFPQFEANWQEATREVIQRNHAREGTLRIAVSRGVGSRGYLPYDEISPNWVIEYLPPTPLPEGPLKLHLSSITRSPLSALPVNHKLAHGIGSTLALMEARDHGCDEAMMLSTEGKLCEAASANLFWIANQKLYTPALATGCLAGTTRAAILRLSGAEEVLADSGVLHNADAIFISNTRLGAWPAVSTKFHVAESMSHPLFLNLLAQLQADRAAYAKAHHTEWK